MNQAFIKEMQDAYTCEGDSITLGAGILDDLCYPEIPITIPIKMFNRHGLISGATGTGKTKTIQNLAGQLSSKGIPVLLMDIKGDLSGIAKPGEENPKIHERHEDIGIPFHSQSFPHECLNLSKERGVKLRATVSEFGPLLISKILGLNDTQSGIMAVAFQYCDQNQLPLLDFKDLKKTLQYLTTEEIEEEYGHIPKNSIQAILRRMVALEQQGISSLFGEPSFEVSDLLRKDEKGQGYISILRLADIQDKPKLFSTFMLELLAEIYASFPEVGDPDQPKLVLFFDEAHLIFEKATEALLEQIETIIKLIRSKGIGIFFCTQAPRDIPQEVLGQLGLKIQHALRAFTAKDRKNIKLVAENFPLSSYYKTSDLLTKLGIGEALVTALNEKGIPTPLIATRLAAPSSYMGPLTNPELKTLTSNSKLIKKYETPIDPQSAHEILTEKIKVAQKKWKKEKSTLEQILSSTTFRQIGKTAAREITRGILGVLGMGGKR